MYLSIDPGHATGWASWSSEGKIEDYGTEKTPREFYCFLEAVDPTRYTKVIVEEFKLFRHKAAQQSGSDFVASRVIGAIEYWSFLGGVADQLVFQPASIKTIAEMWSGKKPKGSHDKSHHIDAYNHGYYWLQRNGIIKPRLSQDRPQG